MYFRGLTLVAAMFILFSYGKAETGSPVGETMNETVTFATHAADADDLYWALVMAESLREFGGALAGAPIRIYLDDAAPELDTMFAGHRDSLGVTIKHSQTPPGIRKVVYSSKVYAAATAEREAAEQGGIVAWLDPDVVFVKEPSAFRLDSGVVLGYRPVQLLNISSRYQDPLNAFWSRLYFLLGVADSMTFRMTTTTDLVEIRPHFNAGMLIVRPEHGILRAWPLALEKLFEDSIIQRMCAEDRKTAIFLHQAAMAGVILAMVSQRQMKDLPESYNYALMFADRLTPARRPASLDDLVMFRHDLAFADSARRATVTDPSKIFKWVKERWPK